MSVSFSYKYFYWGLSWTQKHDLCQLCFSCICHWSLWDGERWSPDVFGLKFQCTVGEVHELVWGSSPVDWTTRRDGQSLLCFLISEVFRFCRTRGLRLCLIYLWTTLWPRELELFFVRRISPIFSLSFQVLGQFTLWTKTSRPFTFGEGSSTKETLWKSFWRCRVTFPSPSAAVCLKVPVFCQMDFF